MNNHKIAAAALVIKNGKVLSVSRKDNLADFGMAGGKLEVGEYPADAVVRELEEETGLIAVSKPKFIYEGFDEFGYYVYTYLIAEWEGEINTTETGKVVWLAPEALMTFSSFGSYNRRVFEAAGLIENEAYLKSVLHPRWFNFSPSITITFIFALAVSIISFVWGMHRQDYVAYLFYAMSMYGAILALVACYCLFKESNE